MSSCSLKFNYWTLFSWTRPFSKDRARWTHYQVNILILFFWTLWTLLYWTMQGSFLLNNIFLFSGLLWPSWTEHCTGLSSIELSGPLQLNIVVVFKIKYRDLLQLNIGSPSKLVSFSMKLWGTLPYRGPIQFSIGFSSNMNTMGST